MSRKWTDEAETRLREMHAAGIGFEQIAVDLMAEFGGNLTRGAISGKCMRLGLVRRTAENKAKNTPWKAAGASKSSYFRRQRANGKTHHGPFVLDVERFEKDTAEPDTGTLTLMQLENHHCRWPCGHPGEPGFLFCGDPSADVSGGRPYCGRHDRVAHTAARPRTEYYQIDTRPAPNRGRRAA